MDKLTILIVDDTPDNLRAMEAVLGDGFPGCSVLTASTADEAMRLAAGPGGAIDIALIDLQMPSIDGIDLTTRLKRSPTIRSIGIILMTSHRSDSAMRARGLDAGADDFVSRPVDNIELAARIRAVLRVRTAEDHLRHLHAHLQDMAEERACALRASEERYHQLFTGMREGFSLHEVVCDEAGTPCDFRFIEVNPAFEQLTGLRADRVRGRTIREMLPSIPSELIERYGRVALTGEPLHLERLMTDLNKYFEISAFRPRPGQFAVVLHDISERLQATAAADDLNRQLAEKNHELSTMLYATSHDLRSPLLNVQGFANELQRTCRKLMDAAAGCHPPLPGSILSLLNADIPECLHYITSGVTKMDRLLSGLLQLSRLGQVTLRIMPVDLNQVVAEVVRTADFQIKSAGAEVRVGPLPTCLGDQVQLNQVFSNLVDNAIKYLDPDRRPGLIRIEGRQESGHVLCSVSGNGIGIRAEHHESIFGVFQRLNTKRGVSGDGLGLATVRRIMERHSGRIWVESQPGAGTTFHLLLPGA
jgi:PAS domain S-box-containing protein